MKKHLRILYGVLAASLVITAGPLASIQSFAMAQEEYTETEERTVQADGTEEQIVQADETEEQIVQIDESEKLSAADLAEARAALGKLVQSHNVMALVYLTDTYAVRYIPDSAGGIVAEVPSGQQVLIKDVVLDEEELPWAEVQFYWQEMEYTGYIERCYLACVDELFLAWEEQYGMNPYAGAAVYSARAGYADVDQFPESYRSALTALKSAHPNWIFVKQNTGLNWDEVVYNEMLSSRSLVPSSYPDAMKRGEYSSGWSYASEGALKYYLDPRNGLTQQTVFQFEQLTYNESYHTEQAVQNFLNGSFMEGKIPDLDITYAKTFWAVGKELGVSPSHLACRVYQEQGRSGGSALISGKYPGYEGYYNYFNIGASGNTEELVIKSGLQKAKEENWYNGYVSIAGGARLLSTNYILKGQDTLYLQKFDVDSSYNGLYWHQYMQNICAPSSEGSNIYRLYLENGALGNAFVFKIPVYNNMPSQACVKPTDTTTTDRVDPVAYTVVGTIGGRNVTFTSPTEGAVIYYSSTTSNITMSDQCIANGETVLFENFYGTIYARAYYRGQWSNVARLILKIPVVNTPEIVQSGSTVRIKTTTPNSILYYTLDGSEPSPNNGIRVNGSSTSFSMGSSGTVKAIAVRSCFTNSDVATAQIQSTVSSSVPVPSFAVRGILGGRTVTFNTAAPGAEVYYSTSPAIASSNDHVRAGGSVDFDSFYGTIYARTYVNGQWSNVARLILKIPTVNTPTITPAGDGKVKITTTTPNSIIIFTLDGSTPSLTNGRRIYASSSVISIGSAKRVRAIAVRSCFGNSGVAVYE